jgi:hypothetical protein
MLLLVALSQELLIMLFREFIVTGLAGGTLVVDQVVADTKITSTNPPYRLVV